MFVQVKTRTKGNNSLACGHTEVYLQIFKDSVNQLTDDELTPGFYQQHGATCHTSNARLREIESFFKRQNYLNKIFGHPDLPV
jgi:hypothetical protein